MLGRSDRRKVSTPPLGQPDAARDARPKRRLADGQAPTTIPLVSVEVVSLLAICTLDMVSSAWLFHRGYATEYNPLLRAAAEAGTGSFVLAKLLSFLPALAVAEWYRRIRPDFVRRMLRWTIAAYLLIYALGLVRQFLP
jgi:hypothetical protein